MSAAEYWKERFSEPEAIKHHSKQNLRISTDFSRGARTRKPFADALGSPRIIEIGCGTGELSDLIRNTYGPDVLYGTDFCGEAVKRAQARYPRVNFWKFDIIKDRPFAQFDLLISSNTLEHFKNPTEVMRRMFALAPLVLLIVPYEQPVTDGYDAEGGAGHAIQIGLDFFLDHKVVDHFLFETLGWDYSSAGELPQQLAVLLS